MNPNNRKTFAIVAAIAVLAVIGAVAWAKRSSDTAPNAFAQPAFGQPASQPAYDPRNPQAPGYVQSSNGYVQSSNVGYGEEDGYYSTIRRPLSVHNAVAYQPQDQLIRETDNTYIEPGSTRSTSVRRNTYVSRPYEREEIRDGRSTGKSVAIVAGTAGVGAAIGAIAGGGKGAAIGAVSGGGAGFVYDRMTHNHVH